MATFAKCGLTEGACLEPLQDKSLDEQGRCLLTYHGEFAIFNGKTTNASTIATTQLTLNRMGWDACSVRAQQLARAAQQDALPERAHARSAESEG